MHSDLSDINDEIRLLRGTISDLTESIERLTDQRDKLNTELRAKIDRRLIWEAKLNGLLALREKPFEGSDEPTISKPKRRRKGENLRDVRELLAKNKERGFSTTEISEHLKIHWSSAHRTLDNNRDIFEEKGNLWFLKSADRNVNGDGGDLLT